MKPVGYFTSIVTPSSNMGLTISLFKITGNLRMMAGSGNDKVYTHLFVHPANNTREELINKFINIPDVIKVSVVAISDPVTIQELNDVRKIFAEMDWDASKVEDERLADYIHSNLKELFTYYLDLDNSKRSKGITLMDIKRLEEHPEFATEWQKESKQANEWMTGDPSTFDESEFEEAEECFNMEVNLEVLVNAPPPPPEPPGNLSKMSDDEIIIWLNEHGVPINENVRIEIKRTSEEITINMLYDDHTEGIIYKLKK